MVVNFHGKQKAFLESWLSQKAEDEKVSREEYERVAKEVSKLGRKVAWTAVQSWKKRRRMKKKSKVKSESLQEYPADPRGHRLLFFTYFYWLGSDPENRLVAIAHLRKAADLGDSLAEITWREVEITWSKEIRPVMVEINLFDDETRLVFLTPPLPFEQRSCVNEILQNAMLRNQLEGGNEDSHFVPDNIEILTSRRDSAAWLQVWMKYLYDKENESTRRSIASFLERLEGVDAGQWSALLRQEHLLDAAVKGRLELFVDVARAFQGQDYPLDFKRCAHQLLHPSDEDYSSVAGTVAEDDRIFMRVEPHDSLADELRSTSLETKRKTKPKALLIKDVFCGHSQKSTESMTKVSSEGSAKVLGELKTRLRENISGSENKRQPFFDAISENTSESKKNHVMVEWHSDLSPPEACSEGLRSGRPDFGVLSVRSA